MSGKFVNRVRLGAALFGCLTAATAVHSVPAAAQSYVGYSEQPADALARNVKILATEPRNFNALIGAGKAALALGDDQAAAGFFGRAEEIQPSSPQPQIGMGAALAQDGDAAGGLRYFARAVQLGANQAMVGSERGLAYDLLGYHAQAQADYRAALVGPDADEARRRLALSLAINGNRQEALSVIAPLMARGDAGAARSRAFVLALTGDIAGARASIEAAMPGASFQMEYFLQKLPTLRSDQKAAAVHLGVFPDQAQLASTPSYASPGYSAPAQSGDRLNSVDQLLSSGSPSPAQAPIARQPQPQQQVATATPRPTAPASAQAPQPAGEVYSTRRVWVQLASAPNANGFADEFRRLSSRHDRLFDGITGYVVEDRDRSRLLIGPFRSTRDANIFLEDLATVRLSASRWVNPPGQIIRRLSAE